MVCETLLFADRAIQEKNGKWGLIGIFDRFTFQNYPTPPLPPWFIFIVLKELTAGRHEFALNLMRESANQVIAPINGELEVGNPSGGVTMVLPLQGVTFPRPDTYVMKLHIDGTYVTERVLNVIAVGSQAGGE